MVRTPKKKYRLQISLVKNDRILYKCIILHQLYDPKLAELITNITFITNEKTAIDMTYRCCRFQIALRCNYKRNYVIEPNKLYKQSNESLKNESFFQIMENIKYKIWCSFSRQELHRCIDLGQPKHFSIKRQSFNIYNKVEWKFFCSTFRSNVIEESLEFFISFAWKFPVGNKTLKFPVRNKCFQKIVQKTFTNNCYLHLKVAFKFCFICQITIIIKFCCL